MPRAESVGLAMEVAGLAALTLAIGVAAVAPRPPQAVALVETPGGATR